MPTPERSAISNSVSSKPPRVTSCIAVAPFCARASASGTTADGGHYAATLRQILSAKAQLASDVGEILGQNGRAFQGNTFVTST